MVKEIKENGRLALDLIGGFHFNAIEGEYCEIQTQTGKRILVRYVFMKQVSTFIKIIIKYQEIVNTCTY